MTWHHLLLGVSLAVLPISGAVAQERDQAPQRPELFEALVRCRAIAEDAARLQCFDSAAAALQTATERREVVVVDRQQVRESRRRLFGLALPRLPIFGGGDDDEDEADDIDHIESNIVSAHQVGYGRWVVRLEDGSTWAQTDDNVIAARPRAGQPVRVNRGALGSYMMRVNNQPGVRVRRVR